MLGTELFSVGSELFSLGSALFSVGAALLSAEIPPLAEPLVEPAIEGLVLLEPLPLAPPVCANAGIAIAPASKAAVRTESVRLIDSPPEFRSNRLGPIGQG
jgi:hypothetical protein